MVISRNDARPRLVGVEYPTIAGPAKLRLNQGLGGRCQKQLRHSRLGKQEFKVRSRRGYSSFEFVISYFLFLT